MADSDAEEQAQWMMRVREDLEALNYFWPELDSDDDPSLEWDYGSSLAFQKTMRLIGQLYSNPYDYDSHLDLVKLLQQGNQHFNLCCARENMSHVFPLTEELWLDWLKEEIPLAAKYSEHDRVYNLFERAVKDYICPEIWLEYARYSIGDIGQEGGIERVRSIFERALITVGLHVTKGSAMWKFYRAFENSMLATMKLALDQVPTSEQPQTVKAQLEKVHALYRRQLGVPLMDMESVFLEYVNWSEEPIPLATLQNYSKALKELQKYKPFEEALLLAETPKLAEYQSYIDFEVMVGDPARIQIIYERALRENCLVPDLWVRYTQYLDRQLKVKELALSAHKRAVRNCPWTVELWKHYLLALERHEVEHRVISEIFEKSLKAPFPQAADYVEIWQTRLAYLRRRVDFALDYSQELDELRLAFSDALKYLEKKVERRFNETGDPFCTLMQTWAWTEACMCNNMQKARELWDAIMLEGNSKYAHMWMKYYNLERENGNRALYRRALYRAVQCTQDYPEHVCEALLTMERVEGTLEEWDAAVERTESRLVQVNKQRAKAAEKEAARLKQEEEDKANQRRQARAKKKAPKRPQRPRDPVKRPADSDWEASIPTKVQKRSRMLDSEEELEVELELEQTIEQERKLADLERQVPLEAGLQPKDSQKETCTVFVSNLSYHMADPEARLRDVFGSCGEVAEVRPIFTNKGAFRGYSYVEFRDEGSALRAFLLDRTVVDGRPMFVSPYVDKGKNPDFKVFKYSTALERHKLFISGLPFSCTKEDLEVICKAHGNVRDIRLVTNRAGTPKGLAYVEFEDEAQASQAVLKLDGLAIGEHVIKVAISNPPARRFPERPEGVGNPSQGQDPRQASGSRRKGRTQLSMVPRALQRQSSSTASAKNSLAQNPPAAPSPSAGEPKKMSNADFAKLLQNK